VSNCPPHARRPPGAGLAAGTVPGALPCARGDSARTPSRPQSSPAIPR